MARAWEQCHTCLCVVACLWSLEALINNSKTANSPKFKIVRLIFSAKQHDKHRVPDIGFMKALKQHWPEQGMQEGQKHRAAIWHFSVHLPPPLLSNVLYTAVIFFDRVTSNLYQIITQENLSVIGVDSPSNELLGTLRNYPVSLGIHLTKVQSLDTSCTLQPKKENFSVCLI